MAGFLPELQHNTGMYVPTTNVWEFNQLLTLDVNSEEFKLLLVRLYQNVNDIANVLNIKDSGYYVLEEFVNGQLFFPTSGIVIGTTDGAGNASGTVPGSFFAVGQVFIIGAETDTVASSLPGPQPMTSTGPSVTHTFNISNGAYNFVGAPANTAIMFFPGQLINTPVSYRTDFRLVVNVGPLGAGVTTVAHNLVITNEWTFTRIYGTATDNVGNNFYPIPFAGVAGSFISLTVDATNVVINNNSGITFNKCLVILEYLKN